MKNSRAKLPIILGLWYTFLSGDPAIILQLEPPPLSVINSIERDVEAFLSKKFINRTPGAASKKLLKAQLTDMGIAPSPAGFPVLYNGYSHYTNQDGLVSFPIRHPHDTVHFVVTHDINLQLIDGNTFAYAIIPKEVQLNDVHVYFYQKLPDIRPNQNLQEDEPQEKQVMWRVDKIETPHNRILPMNSIILLTKKKNIYVQDGNFIIPDNTGSNIRLPRSIYVMGNKQTVKSLLKFMDINRYYDPVKFNRNNSHPKVRQAIIAN